MRMRWIESLEQLVAKKRHLKQAAMQQLLTGKKRLPGFEGQWSSETTRGTCRLSISQSLFRRVNSRLQDFRCTEPMVVVGYFNESNHNTWQVTVTCRGSTCGTVNRTVDRCWITGNAMVVNCDTQL